MAERIQLKEPGSELIMLVRSVKAETIDKNDYWLFGNGAKELLVPQSSFSGQIDGAAESLVGETVRFARSMKMSRANRPYWDINIVGSGAETSAGGELGKPTAGTSVSGTSPAESAKPKMRDAYKDLTKWVLREILPLYAAEFGECGPDVVAACTQTLFIQACKAGKVE